MDQEIFDCGAYARLTGFPRSDCPAEWEEDWLRGYDYALKMTEREREELISRKRSM